MLPLNPHLRPDDDENPLGLDLENPGGSQVSSPALGPLLDEATDSIRVQITDVADLADDGPDTLESLRAPSPNPGARNSLTVQVLPDEDSASVITEVLSHDGDDDDDAVSIVTETLSVGARLVPGEDAPDLVVESVASSEADDSGGRISATTLRPPLNVAGTATAWPQALAGSLPGSQTGSPQGHWSGMMPSGQGPDAEVQHLPQKDREMLHSNDSWFNASNGSLPSSATVQFQCPICLDMCENAVETPCCHNLFCEVCLLSEQHNLQRCPICKEQLLRHQVVPNVPIRRLIDDVPVPCRYEQCEVIARRGDRSRHELVCGFVPVPCKHSSSCRLIPRKNLEQHENQECEYRPVPCPMGCGGTPAARAMDEHLEQDCPMVLCKCEHCETSTRRSSMEDHLRNDCPLVPVTCDLVEDETAERCLHACPRRDLDEHQKTCEFRAASCQHEGCCVVTTARRIESHHRSCAHRRVPCQQCGLTVSLGRLTEHLESDCPENAVPCPFSVHGCPELVKRRCMSDHLQQATVSHLALISSALVLRDMEIEMLKMELRRTREHFEQRLSHVEGQCRGCTNLPASPNSGPASMDSALPNAFSILPSLPDVNPQLQDPPRMGMTQPLPGIVRSPAHWEPRSHAGFSASAGRPRPNLLQPSSSQGDPEGVHERQQAPQPQPFWAAPVHHMLQHRQPSFLAQNGVSPAPVFMPRSMNSPSAPRPHLHRTDLYRTDGPGPNWRPPLQGPGNAEGATQYASVPRDQYFSISTPQSPRDQERHGMSGPGFREQGEQQQNAQDVSPGGSSLTSFNPPMRSSS